jgi:DNA polymerase V
MTALSYFAPDVEIYSIDESFLDLSGFTHQDLTEYSLDLRKSLVDCPPNPIIFLGVAQRY